MQKATKGAILKHRIREMGYTQEELSEVTGVAYSTLKKYLADKCPYDVDLLELFAEKLECSYDYLMGYSKSPDRNLQSVKDATNLSDKAIEKLMEYAKYYEKSEYCKLNIDTTSKIIESEGLVDTIAQYIAPVQETEMAYAQIQQLIADNNYSLRIPLESGVMITVINEVNLLKYQ